MISWVKNFPLNIVAVVVIDYGGAETLLDGTRTTCFRKEGRSHQQDKNTFEKVSWLV